MKKNEKHAFQANKRWKRVIFEPEDWVWVYMRKERFLRHKKSKLMLKRDGSFRFLEGYAHKVDL